MVVTPNYGFNAPELTDLADVRELSKNWEENDRILKKVQADVDAAVGGAEQYAVAAKDSADMAEESKNSAQDAAASAEESKNAASDAEKSAQAIKNSTEVFYDVQSSRVGFRRADETDFTYTDDLTGPPGQTVEIESGGTEDNRYIKFPDGTLICAKTFIVNNYACTAAAGNVYNGNDVDIGEYAHPFVGTPIITGDASGVGGNVFFAVFRNNFSVIRAARGSSATQDVVFNVHAIGRWK